MSGMDEATARFWFHAIAAVGTAVWLSSVVFLAATRRRLAEPRIGEVEFEGDRRALLQRAAAAIADARPGSPLQGCVVDSLSADELRWHSVRRVNAHRGVLRLHGAGGTTRLAYGIDGQGRLLLAAQIVVAVGAVVLAAMFFGLRTYVLPHENPAVRGQALQMAQCVHVLWPPFLLAGLARGLRRAMGDELERIVRNLPFTNAC